VQTIVFDVDSPGGNVAGATEFHKVLLRARTEKPCIAVASYLCASAAFWAMSAATKIIAPPSAQIGGVGVLAIYDDLSAAIEQRGIKREVLRAGKFKGEAIGGPLSAEARTHIQSLIDANYGRMTTDIANGRGVKVAAVREGYGEGFCLTAEAALAAGMIDDIATLDETLARLGVSTAALSLTAATDQEPLAATSQELADDALWHDAILGAVLALELES
jgi:capsid assembly protease